MAMVHHLLSQIPQDLPYETLISRAGDLFVQFPPSELAKEAVSHERYSSLWAYLTFTERYIPLCREYFISLLLYSHTDCNFHILLLNNSSLFFH